ncbi:MAG TPA: alpha/beta hydrolase [Planctomycetota bacterium]|nr:alpha/beta hydrolase [Planctomycetota bacterium]
MKKSLCALALLIAVSIFAGDAAPAYPIQTDIVYGRTSGVELKLDLAVPKEGEGPFPLLVFIHGGGWAGGNKASYHGAIRGWAQKGYVCATVEYRFAPAHRFPAQVEDVKCAVRYLRSRARELKIDKDKVAAIGDSAGGHLSLMLGLMDKDDGLEGNCGCCADESSKVQAVINYYGPTDFTVKHEIAKNPVVMTLVSNFLGTNDQTAPVFKQASPVTYINKGDPPVLTFQGTKDPLVPDEQARHLHAELKKAGVVEKLEIIEGGGHGFSGEVRLKTVQMTEEFLKTHFKK